jgi:hypothetical protein
MMKLADGEAEFSDTVTEVAPVVVTIAVGPEELTVTVKLCPHATMGARISRRARLRIVLIIEPSFLRKKRGGIVSASSVSN